MAYELIETIEVGSGGAASIEFTSIPQDGVDLVFVFSTRSGSTTTSSVQINSDTTIGSYLRVSLEGNGSSATSDGGSSNAFFILTTPSSATADTFTNTQLYISNYTSQANKSISVDNVQENNGSAANIWLTANSYATTSTINSLKVNSQAGLFAEYSTASLYKIY